MAAAVLAVLVAVSGSAAAATPDPEPCDLFGTVVRIGDADVFHPLVAWGVALGYVDNGNGFFSPGEPVYLDSDGSLVVSPSDVRVTGASGSVVLPGDLDIGAAMVVLPGQFGFADADGGSAYNAGDPVYWDTDSSGTVSVSDVRLTPSLAGAAGTTVQLGDGDLGDPLLTPSAQFTFVDGDGDATFTGADIAYVSMSFSASVLPGDVRLSGVPTLLVAEPVVNLAAAPIGLVTPAFRATLTSQVSGLPVPAAAIGFYAAGQLLCSAPTDGTGTAACGTVVEKAVALAAGGYEARYTGSFPHCGSQADGSIL